MGTIVVGVDGSPGAAAALRHAVAEARAHRATLVVVHAWRLPMSELPGPFVLELPAPPVPPIEDVRATLESAALSAIDVALAGVDTAGVTIDRRAVEGAPAEVLIDVSRDADMLVVGARGHGGFRGLLLGSVSEQCTHHAACPVVVVPVRGLRSSPQP